MLLNWLCWQETTFAINNADSSSSPSSARIGLAGMSRLSCTGSTLLGQSATASPEVVGVAGSKEASAAAGTPTCSEVVGVVGSKEASSAVGTSTCSEALGVVGGKEASPAVGTSTCWEPAAGDASGIGSWLPLETATGGATSAGKVSSSCSSFFSSSIVGHYNGNPSFVYLPLEMG